MSVDLTVIISLILALVAIITPIISSIIDNRYKFKVMQFERYSTIKESVINSFIESTLSCKFNNFNIETFYINLNKILLYVDEKSSIELGKIKNFVETNRPSNEINSALMKFILTLNNSNKTKTKQKLLKKHIFHKL